MPYPAPHMLLAWQGVFMSGDTVFDPVDQFAGSIRFDGANIQNAQTEANLDGLVNALSAFWRRGDSFIPQRARIQAVKFNLVNTEGRYVSRSTTLERRDLDIAGTASMIHPLQIAWCATWTTNTKRGLASSGRTFFPTGVEISPSRFTVTDTNANTFAGSCLQLLQSMNDVFPRTGDTAISASVVSNQRDGASHAITGVKVGNRLDVQRRRAEAQDEQYTQKTLSVVAS